MYIANHYQHYYIQLKKLLPVSEDDFSKLWEMVKEKAYTQPSYLNSTFVDMVFADIEFLAQIGWKFEEIFVSVRDHHYGYTFIQSHRLASKFAMFPQ